MSDNTHTHIPCSHAVKHTSWSRGHWQHTDRPAYFWNETKSQL